MMMNRFEDSIQNNFRIGFDIYKVPIVGHFQIYRLSLNFSEDEFDRILF